MFDADTIAAISTSVGQAGIGIVRLSGPASLKIARTVFRTLRNEQVKFFEPRKLMYGLVVEPVSGGKIDEALCVYMPGPNSYTCEDVVEFQAHGSTVVLRKVLQTLIQQGARLALPGEFTQRAFLNGRIDLVQAEAVMSVIQAKTDAALRIANEQLTGTLSKRISEIRLDILELVARLEASMDYPEDDIELQPTDTVRAELLKALAAVEYLLSTSTTGKIVREGLQTVIVGKPNVGKSTLLNALLGEDRALVTDIPGTTRDTIEEYINLSGLPLRIVDTAGLRDTVDQIELLGISRTREQLKNAGLVLFLIDASEPADEADLELLRSLPGTPVIIVVNKIDLPKLNHFERWENLTDIYPVVSLSAKEKMGLDALQQTIEKLVFSGEVHLSEAICVDNNRHVESLINAKQALLSAIDSLGAGISFDCILIDLRAALQSLGQITGETVSDEVVREIFAKFCLGK